MKSVQESKCLCFCITEWFQDWVLIWGYYVEIMLDKMSKTMPFFTFLTTFNTWLLRTRMNTQKNTNA